MFSCSGHRQPFAPGAGRRGEPAGLAVVSTVLLCVTLYPNLISANQQLPKSSQRTFYSGSMTQCSGNATVVAIGPRQRCKFLTVPLLQPPATAQGMRRRWRRKRVGGGGGGGEYRVFLYIHTYFWVFTLFYFSLHGRLWANWFEAGSSP